MNSNKSHRNFKSASSIKIRQISSIETLFNKGLALHRQGLLDEAAAVYKKILSVESKHFDSLHLLGVIANQSNNPILALELIKKAIAIKPNIAASYSNLGNAFLRLKLFDNAITNYDRAIELEPKFIQAYENRGIALIESSRLEEALLNFEHLLLLKPESIAAYYQQGNVLQKLKRYNEAIASYNSAIALKPDYAEAYSNRGVALKELMRLEEAIESYAYAIKLKPDYADALNNIGNTLLHLERLEESLKNFDKAIALENCDPKLYANRSVVLNKLERTTEAMDSLNKAIKLQPNLPEYYVIRGELLQKLNRLEEALDNFKHAINLKPDYPFLMGTYIHIKGKLCCWENYDNDLDMIKKGISADTPISPSFPLLALIDDPGIHLQAAYKWMHEKMPPKTGNKVFTKKQDPKKIHVAYISADFHNHATSYLMAELFELHNRERFELTAISFGPDQGDEIRQRISKAFDRFQDVRRHSDSGIARFCREIGVDIAIDLKGFTQDSRPGILAERCAPIQINWLGYPGSMASHFIDFIIADRTLIPESDFHYYLEKVIWLPDTYQVNDSKRPIANQAPSRTEYGLPEEEFVFCCFNNNYKILPDTFNVWMRILQRVPASVLWLLEDNKIAAKNLKAEAFSRGIDPKRLIFAKRLPLDEHLARHRIADLFIDTWPYNAHTTASDALWVGLPVLTKVGLSFASRVAASLLNAIGMPELITHTVEDYEELAVTLATHPEALAEIRLRLATNRDNHPLFDCIRFTRNLESIFEKLIETNLNITNSQRP